MLTQHRTCQHCKFDFVIEPRDFEFYEKLVVPAPTFCSLCRAQRRFAFRNERKLYRRMSAYSHKEIFSKIPPETPVQVYENSVWESDEWDASHYGVEVDFSKPFFTQLHELYKAIPHRALAMFSGVNSDYCNNFTAFKNCYLAFNGSYTEDSMYSNGISYSKECVDCSHVGKCELCYEGFWLTACSRAFFSSQCENCFDVYFCKNCNGCSNCFSSVNLRNKQYCFFNEQLSKEEYERRMREYDFGSYSACSRAREAARAFWLRFPNKYIEGVRNNNVTGSYIFGSKDVFDSYLIREGENLRYCHYLQDAPNKDCYDHSMWGNGNELTYECVICGKGNYCIRFCFECWPNLKNSEYCMECGTSSDLFGCVGLKNKQFCILNTQYAEGEFRELRAKIIAHMNTIPYIDPGGCVYRYGEFFPASFSPYGYNDTIAIEHFPLAREGAQRSGIFWRDTPVKDFQTTMPASALPDHIRDVSDEILQATIECVSCKRAYRILRQELHFYRTHQIALPRLCIDCRHRARISQRNTVHLWERRCMCGGTNDLRLTTNDGYKNTATHSHGESVCSNQFRTSYAPERSEIVYCEECYQAEVA